MIVVLVMRMVMTVVGMTVVLMMMTGIGHRILAEELPVTIQHGNSCRFTCYRMKITEAIIILDQRFEISKYCKRGR